MVAERLSNFETHKRRAQKQAERDFTAGGPCDPERYHARPGSAWATWYTSHYEQLAAGEGQGPHRPEPQ